MAKIVTNGAVNDKVRSAFRPVFESICESASERLSGFAQTIRFRRNLQEKIGGGKFIPSLNDAFTPRKTHHESDIFLVTISGDVSLSASKRFHEV